MSLILLFRNRRRKQRGGFGGVIYRRKKTITPDDPKVEIPLEVAPTVQPISNIQLIADKLAKQFEDAARQRYTEILNSNIANYQVVNKKLDNIRQSLIQAFVEEQKMRERETLIEDLIDIKNKLNKLLELELQLEDEKQKLAEQILQMQEEEEMLMFLLVD